MDLLELSNDIGCSIKALTRKAEKLRLFRAKNNEVKDGIKFCTLCNTYHESEEFYADKAQNSELRYNCKKYYDNYKLKHIKQRPTPSTPPLYQKRGNPSNRGDFKDYKKEKISHRPRNPVVFKNGIEGKICNQCKDWKPLEHFGLDKKGIRGRRARCRICYKNNNSK